MLPGTSARPSQLFCVANIRLPPLIRLNSRTGNVAGTRTVGQRQNGPPLKCRAVGRSFAPPARLVRLARCYAARVRSFASFFITMSRFRRLRWSVKSTPFR